MNRSKLYEWLLDNDCPWDFDDAPDLGLEQSLNETTLVFTDKEEETEVRDMTDQEYWNSPEIKELLTK